MFLKEVNINALLQDYFYKRLKLCLSIKDTPNPKQNGYTPCPSKIKFYICTKQSYEGV